MPEKYEAELAAARRLGVEPKTIESLPELMQLLEQNPVLKWVVTMDNKLKVVPAKLNRVEITHAVAAGGGRVRAAGELKHEGGVLRYNRWSGHYMPDTWSPGENALNRLGLPVKFDGLQSYINR